MLYGPMLHPELLRVLAAAGHGATILLADSNYPHGVWVSKRAERIALNLAPGLLTVNDVLEVLKRTIPIEAAAVMVPAPDAAQVEIPAHDDFKAILPEVPFRGVMRWDFYDLAKSDDLCCVVATGDQRLYANLLLTVGVRQPGE
ncbi:MAG TPA: RbsD/FucU family protein [Propionibacteriaceae bacterium]|nr:RbsD/FucU family protein [Propionibacteriaceae bacterium]HQE31403.1 RbsD/FucU family protein [Propionibacteriaceae bacterium]